jgi:hypothetical protein
MMHKNGSHRQRYKSSDQWGDEVPVLPLSSLAPPLQIRAINDPQHTQSGETFYPLRQGFDARAVPDREVFKGAEAAHGFGKASQPPQPSNIESAQRAELPQPFRQFTKCIATIYMEHLEGCETNH